MEIRDALKEQYHGAMAMLAECVEKCPDDLWTSGEYPRYYWRIALHAAFFTQLQLPQDEHAYEPWPDRPRDHFEPMWLDPAYVEPYELPDGVAPFSREDTLSYIRFVDSMIDPVVDALDLDCGETGFSWYPNMSKLSHELMNLRHIQGHVGQLSELLMARGIDTDWVPKLGYE